MGVVVGFDTSDGGRDFIAQLWDGRKMVFENDARLLEVVKGSRFKVLSVASLDESGRAERKVQGSRFTVSWR